MEGHVGNNKKFIYAKYKGDNDLGIPHGFGKLEWLKKDGQEAYDPEEEEE